MRVLRQSLLVLGVLISLLCGLVQATPALASQRGPLRGALPVGPHAPVKLMGRQPGRPTRPTQAVLPASGPRHDVLERLRGEVAARQAPKPSRPQRRAARGTAARAAARKAPQFSFQSPTAAPWAGREALAPAGPVPAGSTYGVSYAPQPLTVQPRYDTFGLEKVRVTNTSALTWAANSLSLDYHLKRGGVEYTRSSGIGTLLTVAVPPGNYIDLNVYIDELPEGTYQLNWDLRRLSDNTFYTALGIPASAAVPIVVPHYAPTAELAGPLQNASVATLSPLLDLYVYADFTQATSSEFQLCPESDTSSSSCWDSGWRSVPMSDFFASSYLPPPTGFLSWNHTYHWRARVKDASFTTPWSDLSAFTTVVTPAAGAHFGPGQADPAGVDLFQGNFSRTETDFSLPANGGNFSIARVYNSSNPASGAFGPGWSSVLDFHQTMSADGTMVVTYPDGRQLHYGQNPDDSWVPAYGQSDEAASVGPGLVSMPDGTDYYFNADGTVQSVASPGKVQTYFTYGAAGGRLSRIDLGTYRQLYVQWNSTGQISAISTNGAVPVQRGPGIETRTYAYTSNRLTFTCNQRWDVSACTGYAYNGPNSRLSAITPPNGSGEAVAVDYASSGRVSYVTLPNPGNGGDHWAYTRLSAVDANASFVLSVLQPTGQVTYYQFDSLGDLLNRWYSTEKPQPSNNKIWTYDLSGRLSGTIDENQNTVEYHYDGWGHLEDTNRMRDASTVVNTHYEFFAGDAGQPYDPQDPRAGKITEAHDAEHHATFMAYNNRGMLSTRTDPPRDAQHTAGVTHYHYTCESADWSPSSGPPVVDDPANTGIARQPCGLLSSVTDPDNRTTSYGYDAYGEQTRIVTPTGATTDQYYDGLGHVTHKVETTPAGQTAATDYVYDGAGHLTTQTDPAVANPVTGVVHQKKTVDTYDKDGNLLTSTVSDTTPAASGGDKARTTQYGYDVQGRQSTVKVDGVQTSAKTYDGDGNVVTSTDGDGVVYDYRYEDPRGLLSAIVLPNWTDNYPGATPRTVPISTYYYDNAGRLSSTVDSMGSGVVTYTYTPDDLRLTESFENYTESGSKPRRLPLHSYTYDLNGNVTNDISGDDLNNVPRRTMTTYDPTGLVKSSTVDPGGLNRTTTYTYDHAGLVLSTALTDGSRTEQTTSMYEPAGRVTRSIVDNDATPDLVTAYTRDGNGQVLTTTDPRGVPTPTSTPDPAYTTTNAYDALGRLSTTTAPMVQVEDGTGAAAVAATPGVGRGYNTFGELSDVRDARGKVTHTAYDSRSRKVEVDYPTSTEPNGTVVSPVEKWTYDGNGNVLTHVDRLGQTTNTTYDNRNRPLQVTAPAATAGGSRGTTTLTWDDDGNLGYEASPAGTLHWYHYDAMGRLTFSELTERFVDDGTGEASTYVTQYGYDEYGDPVRKTGAGAPAAYRTYDAIGEVTADIIGGTVNLTLAYDYDVSGRLVRTTDSLKRHTDVSYDLAGRAVRQSTVDASGKTLSTTSFTNDAAGNVTAVTDPDQQTWQSAYDALNRLDQLTDPTPTDANGTVLPAPTTSFGYDAAGNQTRVTDGDNHATYTTYDAWNLPSVQTAPATAAQPAVADRTWQTSYNALGEPVAGSQPGGVTTTSGYDLLGRLTSQSGSGAEGATQSRQFGYDLGGRLTSISAPAGAETFVWDDQDKLYSYSRPATDGTGNVTYAYNYGPGGQLSKRSGPEGTSLFSWNASGQLSRSVDALTGNTRTYSYNEVGQLTRQTDKTSGGAVADSYSFDYDGLGRPSTEVAYDSAQNSTGQISYTWDGDDDLTASTGTGTLGGESNRTNRYDADNRLISSIEQGTETDYSWDGAGNRLSSTVSTLSGGAKLNPVTTTAQYDERDRLIRTDSPQAVTTYQWRKRGTLDSTTTTPTGGSPVTTTSLSDAFNQEVSDGGTRNSYDALGRLAVSGGQTFQYDGLDSDPSSDGAWLYARDAAGNAVSAKSPAGQTSSLLTNTHHDVIGAADPASGGLRAAQSFGPFGEQAAHSSALSPLGFQGDWTAGSGKVDAGARWYDPSSGTFLSQDSAPGPISGAASANLYGYGAGNPASAYDPSGHSFLSVLEGAASDTFDGITAGLGDVEAAGDAIIRGAGAAIADAAPEIADAVGTALVDAGIDIAAGATCVIGCAEALVAGAVVVVMIAGISYTLSVGVDGTLYTEGPTTAPVTTPTSVGTTTATPNPEPAPPGPVTPPKPVLTSATNTTSWSVTTSWYDDTYLYTRTDTYVQTVTTFYVDGVRSGSSTQLEHSWRTVAQELIPTEDAFRAPTPRVNKPVPPGPGGIADPDGQCGAGGSAATCLTGIGSRVPVDAAPDTATGGGTGGGGGPTGPPAAGGCTPGPDDGEWVDPNLINFSQRTVSPNDYVESMLDGGWDWNRPGTALRVIERDGQLVSYDNRRLDASRDVRSRNPDYRVKVERVDPESANPEKSSGMSWDQSFEKRMRSKRNQDENGCRVPWQGLSERPEVEGK
ncbi:DUF6531 domain-containing protein [Streptomyces polygonati]|uniref:DUF6531 domain-containing protein n=1 Tax=Streptomyces polygonati TaxID=1617087 RepID=A0ABV8HFS8_9ACTN